MERRATVGGAARVAAVVFVCVLSLSAGFPAQAVAPDRPDGARASVGPAAGPFAQEAPNGTVRHEDPRRAGEDGDTGRLESHLVSTLTERLGESTVRLNGSNYEGADEALGSEYSEALSKYVEVSGDDRTARELRRAQERQRNLTDDVRRYRRTYERYEEAKRNGDDERARRLARQLNQIASEVDRTSAALNRSLARVENGSGADLDRSQEDVADIRRNVSGRQATVDDAEFVRTEIDVSAESERASFVDPVRIEGTLARDNGSAVADHPVAIRVGERTYRTRTGVDGSFGVTYRPTAVPASATEVTVEFVPENDSEYLGATATLPLDVERTNGSLVLTDAPDRTAYDRTVSVAGAFTVDGEPVTGASVRATLGGIDLGTVRTDANGQVRVTTTVPSDVPSGDQPLRLRPADDGAAVGAPPDERIVRVASTPTEITVDAGRPDGRTVDVFGRLSTAGGAPAANRSVSVLVDGAPRATVETDANGSYRATITLPERTAEGNASAALVARFSGAGTSLEPSRARTTVPVPAANGGIESILGRRTLAAGAAVFVLALVGALVLLRGGSGTDAVAPTTAGGGSGGRTTDAVAGGTALLATARDRLDRGETDGAVRSAYAAVRRWGADAYGIPDVRTHWEFYRASRERGRSPDGDALRDLTRVYERAAFDRRPTDESEASGAIEAAKGLIGADETD